MKYISKMEEAYSVVTSYPVLDRQLFCLQDETGTKHIGSSATDLFQLDVRNMTADNSITIIIKTFDIIIDKLLFQP